MKVLRFFCNIILFIAVTIGISLTQIAVYDIIAAQSDDVKAIHIAAPTDDSVAYLDSYVFWVDDIKTNLAQEPKYRIRNWVGAEWWKNGMSWADTGLDIIAGITKPILVPIAQVNAVRVFRGKNINDFNEYFVNIIYKDETAYNNALYEQFVIFKDFVGENVPGEVKTTTGLPIEEYEYTGDYSIENPTKYDYSKWLVKNKQLYNNTWKLNKYNSEVYGQYFEKFLIEDEISGERHIKPAAIVLYYQQTVSIILAALFVMKYPISFVTARYVGKKGDRQA